MFYKVKVWSAEDSTQRKCFYTMSCLPYVSKQSIEEYLKANTVYQVSVIALPPYVTQLKKSYKLWDLIELGIHIKSIEFFTHKWLKCENSTLIDKFYKLPFVVDVVLYNNYWYSFFKYPAPFVTNLKETIEEILMFTPRISKSNYYYLPGKYIMKEENSRWALYEITTELVYFYSKCSK